ncbi:high mobility group B protein 9-like [Zingiber officinale]|uniref:high mobility group B protein 9-like n=1 Tax=Zingiber officinale TaxID=94328 RepID=UPI001C4DC0DE|nr:high mobility group B protein 9-like [Zingiber officinale]
MVTVKIGTETLRGVLYHVQQQPSPAATPEAPESSSLRTRRKRRQQRRRDPAHPKPNKSAYNFFFAKKHSNLKALYLHRESHGAISTKRTEWILESKTRRDTREKCRNTRKG